MEVLKRLRALEKKAAVYLNGKLDTDSPEADDDILYEKLGGIWKLDQLEGLGLKKEHARLVQLSFQVIYDEARKEYIDIGYWADVDTGEISSTYNYRPVKALKYVKQEDSCFDVVNTPMLCYYPGGMNKRIRWENADFEPMVYGGLVNKNIVAGLQARGVNALGLTGADMDVIRSVKRPVKEVDYGFVGDVRQVNAAFLADLIHKGVVPVMAPLTHDGEGHMLNTNADTIAGETAKALAGLFDVTLVFCFEKKGVLRDENDDDSVISQITPEEFKQYVADGVIQGGMIPKLENSFEALNAGVAEVVITLASAINGNSGTRIRK